MNASSEDTATDLLELAKASWNPDLLVPCRPELIATRPLMVLRQSIDDQPQSANVDDIRRSAQEQLAQTASLSYFLKAQEGVSVLFLTEFGDDPELVGAIYGDECQLRVATDIREAMKLAAAPSVDLGSEDEEPLRPQHLWSLIVLPEPSAQSIDLESIEGAIPDFTGKAYWYACSDERVKVQGWDEGDLDTGYLWAIREGEDAEGYTLDAAPGRTLFASFVAAENRRSLSPENR